MPVTTLEHASAPGATPGADPVRRRFARLAGFAAVYSYLLVVFGGIVRITGSGLGCGDDWPLCNGHLLPPWDLPTWIEWTHRLLAAGLIVPIALVAFAAIRHRRRDGFGGPGGAGRAALAAIILLAIQVLLGAATVKLDLPAGVTALHFVNAILLLAALVFAAIRAGGAGSAPAGGAPAGRDAGDSRRFARSATVAAILGLIVVTLGALTANTGLVGAQTAPSAAAWACQGFPLCNGEIVPAGGPLVHIHWTHRLLAFLLLFHMIGAVIAAFRRGAPRPVALAAAASLILALSQIAIAAALVLLQLPASMRVLHLVVGVALWMALAAWAAYARPQAVST